MPKTAIFDCYVALFHIQYLSGAPHALQMTTGTEDADVNMIAFVASYLELCLLLAYFAVLGLLIRVVIHRPQFHHNLLYLMTSIALHGVVAMAARTVQVAWTLIVPDALSKLATSKGIRAHPYRTSTVARHTIRRLGSVRSRTSYRTGTIRVRDGRYGR